MRYAVIFWGAKRKEKSQKLVTTICTFLSFFLCIMETALLLLHSLNFNERKSWSSFSMQKSLTTSEKLHSFFLFSFPDLKFFYLVYSNNVLFFIEIMGINLLHCVSCLLFTANNHQAPLEALSNFYFTNDRLTGRHTIMNLFVRIYHKSHF